MITLTLTDHQLTILKALVEYAALSTPNGANADETTEIYLQHIDNDLSQQHIANFITKAREALKEQP